MSKQILEAPAQVVLKKTMAEAFKVVIGGKDWTGNIFELAKLVAAQQQNGNIEKCFAEINNNYLHGNGNIVWNKSYVFTIVSGKGKEKVVTISYIAPVQKQ